MRPETLFRSLLVCLALAGWCMSATAQVNPVPGDPLTGNGNVTRTVLTYTNLFSSSYGSSPVNDTSGFGLPTNAAQPSQSFEGTLTLNNTATSGNFTKLTDIFNLIPSGSSAWKHVATFSFQFVQNGSYFIPAQQGLIYTGNADWNYIIGPGRVWLENSDNGYMRVALPFALVQRNQNCVHNGEMTFLFNSSKSPNVSNVYYQITKETCYPMTFNMWGQVTATYTPGKVANDTAIENAEAAEVTNRMPTKPFSVLTTDFPSAGLMLSNFTKAFTNPSAITTYGLVINGTNYSSGNNCQTRFGNYAFCGDMRLPSYSIAKSAFADTAMMRLGELYGTGVYSLLIKSYVPQYVDGGNWNSTTFTDASDMATGNYNSSSYMSDENSTQTSNFLDAEAYNSKIADAFVFKNHFSTPDTVWVYQSVAQFILTQGMNAYLRQQQGSSADIFNRVLNDVYTPIDISQGGQTTIRTDNSTTGKPNGYYGLLLIQDDVAKIGNFLNNGNGVINGTQILEPTRLQESLFRNPNVTGLLTSMVTDPDTGKAVYPNSMFYKDSYWGKTMTPGEFPQYSCTFRVPFMSGYGGNTVLLLPNGVTYYIFSEGDEFHWYDAVNEINKIAPLCH